MNKKDRKELAEAIGLIERANEIIERLKEQEEEKVENMGDGFGATERGIKITEDASSLEESKDGLDEIIFNLQTLTET